VLDSIEAVIGKWGKFTPFRGILSRALISNRLPDEA
jgi:hypothetical protein